MQNLVRSTVQYVSHLGRNVADRYSRSTSLPLRPFYIPAASLGIGPIIQYIHSMCLFFCLRHFYICSLCDGRAPHQQL